jgi:hypothetical protein
MKSDFSTWARQHSDTLTAEDLSTAFRDLQEAHYTAGWRRNLSWVALAVSVVAALGWAVLR